MLVSTNLITGIEDENQIQDFKLAHKNYPNPFNPSTVISFKMVNAAQVKIEIFNNIGQHMTTLLNEHKPAGVHNISFNAENYTRGVYYYRLKFDNQYMGSGKMILLR